jgi:cold shock CspA family protein
MMDGGDDLFFQKELCQTQGYSFLREGDLNCIPPACEAGTL